MEPSDGRASLTISPATDDGAIRVVRLRGELIAQNCPALARALAPLLDGLPRDLMLDLSAVTAADAEGLALLARVHHTLWERGNHLLLSRASSSVVCALATTRLAHLLHVNP